MYDRLREFRIGERIESGHMPLVVEEGTDIETEEKGSSQEEEEEENKKKEEKITIISWDEEAIQRYEEKTRMWEQEKGFATSSIEEKWIRLKEKVMGAMMKKRIKKKKKKMGDKDWWDKECTRKKREVKKSYKKWKRGEINRERYIEERRKLREKYEEKQKNKRKKEEEELKRLRNETDICKFIN